MSVNRVPLDANDDGIAASLTPSYSLSLVIFQWPLPAKEPLRPVASVRAVLWNMTLPYSASGDRPGAQIPAATSAVDRLQGTRAQLPHADPLGVRTARTEPCPEVGVRVARGGDAVT